MNDEIDWYGPDAATFGDRVSAAREQAGLSQAELARRLGVRQSTLRGWEDDHSEPRANRLSMLAGLLNVSMMWLINGEGEGIGAPEDRQSMPEDINDILTEMRSLRSDLLKRAENLGRLEKRLRRALSDQVHG
ncbi:MULTISPECIES: helix-turn-helix domain-containing protein [unclassified Sulfitobacter]|jgi:transcriptional regulator with XRE-family HTH domain|uniref:helix-turn-helix domain-containing protein n=1 Tax=unclassified Sulfitobacter TaxID=196795 RepID=UPI0007C214A4|nr:MULTISPECIES: helix-turn-helix domain-containing protein [unclassified Sulfitobacter]KZY00641.1 transcriptional regulator [Sulfitobacter sp. HI0023]KZY25474.1 transcriptional regulator [Sulfitobacter sp. HI0040]KZZ68581.1 transcriptional regulator [Sulfitobacter sp. HI0129]